MIVTDIVERVQQQVTNTCIYHGVSVLSFLVFATVVDQFLSLILSWLLNRILRSLKMIVFFAIEFLFGSSIIHKYAFNI